MLPPAAEHGTGDALAKMARALGSMRRKPLHRKIENDR